MKFSADSDATDETWDGTVLMVEEERTYICNEVCAAGQWMALDLGATTACQKVALADAGTVYRACTGVALEAGVVGGKVRVLKKGIYPSCYVASGSAKGGLLYGTTTAGTMDDTAPSDETESIKGGIQITAESGGLAGCYVNAPF